MSKLNQIQAELKGIDQAKFQKICDAYLHKRGYDRVNPLGVVIGADKVVKGTPDTLISLPNGRYVFAEYTTQKEGVFGKFLADLQKCFNEEKTGIPVGHIQEIILCHNSHLSPEDTYTLTEECRHRGCLLTLFGVGPLSYDLYQKYPGLAKDFLGVEVDTRQIVDVTEFVASYNKGALATPLDTPFHFREDELRQVQSALEEGDLVIISGRAGVGKSRLALEGCNQFAATHPGFAVRCIFNRGANLFEDLQVHFALPGKYVIFVDDANRVNTFDYVLQLLHDQNEQKTVKVIATVRDYALDKIRQDTQQYGNGVEVQLQPLTDKQIEELIAIEFNIRHHLYRERVVSIAKGNPRLAIMAARIAVRANTLQSIADVSALYDEYFSSVRRDLEAFGNEKVLMVGGIVAFFRLVDRSDAEMMQRITQGFGISADEFWRTVQQLHDCEFLDLYENEVVRVSDQVLATYFFYLAFFKQQVLDFSTLLEHFFPRFRARLVEALNPVLGAFNYGTLCTQMRPHVDRVWKAAIYSGDNDVLLSLMEMFWFLNETETLLWFRTHIEAMKSEPCAEIQFKADPSSHTPIPRHLSILALFRDAETTNLRIAFELLLEYLEKRPRELPHFFSMLTERFGFQHTSYISGYEAERTVITALINRTRGTDSEFSQKVFLQAAKYYLQTHFDTTKSRTGGITFIQFDLSLSPELKELRRTVWQYVFELYRIPSLRREVLRVVQHYCRSGHRAPDVRIIEGDADLICSFFKTSLERSSCLHCLVVHEYMRFLKRCNIKTGESIVSQFTNETHVTSEILLTDPHECAENGWEADEQRKSQRIQEHFAGYGYAEYEGFFEQCADLLTSLDQDHEKSQVKNRIVQVLLALADRNPPLFGQVLQSYLQRGDPFELDHRGLSAKFTEICGAKLAYDILSRSHLRLKRRWLFNFYKSLPTDELSATHLARLYELYREAEPQELPYGMEYLLRYLTINSEALIKVTTLLLERSQHNSRFGFPLADLFNPYSEVSKRLRELFANDVDLLMRAYCAAREGRSAIDYRGDSFNVLLDLDRNFIRFYVEWLYRQKEWISRDDDHRDYDFLWRRADYEEVMHCGLETVFQAERERYPSMHPYAQTFFQIKQEKNSDPLIKERQRGFLRQLITQRHSDVEFMAFIFNLISHFPPQERRDYRDPF